MCPAQQSPELATSNSTANRFLGTAQKPWMTNGTFKPTQSPKRPAVATSHAAVTATLPSRPCTMPSYFSETPSCVPMTGYVSAPFDPVQHRMPESVEDGPAAVSNVGLAPVSPVTPGAYPSAPLPSRLHAPHGEQSGPSPTLPSPEPSTDLYINQTATTEADRAGGPPTVAPAASALARAQSASGEGAPATEGYNNSSSRSSNNNLSSALYPSPTPVSAPLDIQSLWKHARGRLRVLLDKSNRQISLSETVELPRVRILQDACVTEDLFYLALHQVYCIHSYAPSQLQPLSQYGLTSDVGLHVIKQLLVDNQRLSGDFLKWCVTFPWPLSSLLEVEAYRSILAQVAYCLSVISKHWVSFEHSLRARGFPPQVEEFVDRLGVRSSVLQTIMFTALSRRLFGSREQLLKDCIAIFERDQASYKRRGTWHSRDEKQRETSSFKEQYQRACIAHGVLRKSSSNQHQAKTISSSSPHVPMNITLAGPTPAATGPSTTRASPAQSPATVANGHPMSNSPAVPPPQQQGPLTTHAFYPPPSHHTLSSQASPLPSRPVPAPSSGFHPNMPSSMPPNTASWQSRHPPQHPPLSIPLHAPHHQPSQTSPQAFSIPTSRQGPGKSPVPIPSPNNLVSNTQLHSPSFQSRPHHGPLPPNAGSMGQPVSSTSPTIIPPPNTGPSPFPIAYSPYPIGQHMQPPYTYGQPALYPPGIPTLSIPAMPFPSQLISKPEQQQASPVKQGSSAASSPTIRKPSSFSPPKSDGRPMPAQPGMMPEAVPTLVHYFSDFAIPPARLTYNRSSFKWQFSVSREMLGKRPRLAPQQDSRTLVPYFSDNNVSYRLRCIKYEGQVDVDSLAAWSRAESSWPDVVYIHVNNKELHRPHNSKNLPLDINRFLTEGTNEIRLNVLRNTQQRTRNLSYAIAVEVLKFKSTRSFRNSVKNLPSQNSRQQIQNRLAVSNDDEDLVIMDNFISIDLRDPFTTRIFDTPVRGSACTHRECFDLSTFLQTITFTSSSMGRRTPYLRCPICRKDARPHMLIIDNFLLEVRAALSQEQKLETAKAIRVKSDGSWEAVLENDNEPRTPSKNLKRDRASFEADLPKDEDSREVSLSRIPEAPEVIELD